MPLATLSKIFGLASIAFGILSLLTPLPKARLKRTVAGAALKQHKLNKAIYGGPHERTFVGLGAIAAAGLDEVFYEQTTKELERLGFVPQADYVNVTLQRAMPNATTILRSLIGDEGRIMSAVYHLRATTPAKIFQSRNVEMETEFTDGTFATTSTASRAAKTSEFPGISRRFTEQGTTPADLLNAHQRHVAEMLTDKQGVEPVIMRDAAELYASQDRLHMLKTSFRNSGAFRPDVEIQRVAGKQLNAAQQDFAAQTARLHAEALAKEGKPSPLP